MTGLRWKHRALALNTSQASLHAGKHLNSLLRHPAAFPCHCRNSPLLYLRSGPSLPCKQLLLARVVALDVGVYVAVGKEDKEVFLILRCLDVGCKLVGGTREVMPLPSPVLLCPQLSGRQGRSTVQSDPISSPRKTREVPLRGLENTLLDLKISMDPQTWQGRPIILL